MNQPDNFPQETTPVSLSSVSSSKSVIPTHSHHHSQSHSHHHPHHHPEDCHGHTHGAIDPEIATSERGLWAVKWSFVALTIAAIIQGGIFWISGSVALLGDLIHNIGDAVTSIPLAVAFLFTRRQPSQRFAYGYGRTEDLAGLAIIGLIFVSAVVTGYESIERFLHPQPLEHLGALAAAAVVGFVCNELVALFRIRVGREINSAALVADGYHARADGIVSLAVLISAIGVALGYGWADPVVGLVITVILLRIIWESGQTIFTRLLDGVEPETLETLRHSIEHVVTPNAIAQLRARWLGHRLHVEAVIKVDPTLSIVEGEAISAAVKAQLQEHVSYLANILVEIQPDLLYPYTNLSQPEPTSGKNGV
ncbi:MAG: cation transporter [Oscillatoriales cyanobacterium RM2_1_1]|nr:cation transporter [Oscillatoriales cyanobacterium RM2_1_1]